MIIGPGHIDIENGQCRISWEIRLEGRDRTFPEFSSGTAVLWTEWPADYFVPEEVLGDSALLHCLPAALAMEERIVVTDPVSHVLIENALEAIAVYHSYFPHKIRIVELEARAATPTAWETDRRGSFFSGGVDSLYNVVESRRLSDRHGTRKVTDLWLVQGMDIPIRNEVLWNQVRPRLRESASRVDGVRYVEVRTNARLFQNRIAAWEDTGFGPILGGVAKCFSPIVDEALIGSGRRYADVRPHASTPLVDPLWSCDLQRVRHFSCRVNRREKVATIAEHAPEMFRELRVCWQNPGNAFNCGTCEKCMRTQLELDLAGCLDRCDTFDVRLSEDALKAMRMPIPRKNSSTLFFWGDIADKCEAAGKTEYARIIRKKIRFVRTVNAMPFKEKLLKPLYRSVRDLRTKGA